MKKIAFITGITGQDGSYLTELLLEKNYQVYGIIRRSSTINTSRIDHIFDNKNLHIKYGDLIDICGLQQIFLEIENKNPDIIEVYNLGAQSHVKVSFDIPIYTSQVNSIGTLYLLEIIRKSNIKSKYRFYQASTSEMFGKMVENPANENTPFYPRSPYGVAKLYGHWMTKNYRESYDMFNVSGILFNHESERRGIEFVTRKITDGVARINLGIEDHISLGNLDSRRDWGYSPDYVECMWLMMQQDIPEDYVIATGKSHSIREFLDIAFSEIGISDWSKYVKQDSKFMRPAEIDVLCGDASKAREVLDWKPSTPFETMIRRMVVNDIKNISVTL